MVAYLELDRDGNVSWMLYVSLKVGEFPSRFGYYSTDIN